jgi:hypothetical protein
MSLSLGSLLHSFALKIVLFQYGHSDNVLVDA